VLSIDQVNEVVIGGRLAPTFVSPIAAAIRKHAGKIPDSCDARSGKAGAVVGVDPTVATVGGPVEMVHIIVRKTASSFVHAGDVQVARNLVAGDLNVANKRPGVAHGSLVGPGNTVISGVPDHESAATDCEVVPGNVHSSEERGEGIIIRPAGLSVV
jgi:hypothetical protein